MTTGTVVLLLTAVLLPLAVNECRDWFPWLAKQLVRWAARRLGDPQSCARYEEEWVANISAVPGKLSPLLSAVGYVLVLPRMRWTLRRAPHLPKPKPMQLPSYTLSFTGRSFELAALNSLLEKANRKIRRAGALVAVISSSTGGIGKTALALQWAHRNKEHFPDGHLYAHLRGSAPSGPPPPAEVLGRFLKDLGVPTTHVPAGLNERAAIYQNLISRRRMLILLDDAATESQVRLLLPNSPLSTVLITSRSSLPALVNHADTRRLTLDLLREDEAVAVLRTVVGTERADAEPQAAAELVRLCVGLPLAIHIAAGILVGNPCMPIDRLVEDLLDKAAVQDRLASVNHWDGVAVHTVFNWAYQALPEDAARLFRRLGVLPIARFTQRQAETLAGNTPEETVRLLDILLRAHMIAAEPEPGRYRTHDLLLAYARDLLNDEPPRSRAILRRLVTSTTFDEKPSRPDPQRTNPRTEDDDPR